MVFLRIIPHYLCYFMRQKKLEISEVTGFGLWDPGFRVSALHICFWHPRVKGWPEP